MRAKSVLITLAIAFLAVTLGLVLWLGAGTYSVARSAVGFEHAARALTNSLRSGETAELRSTTTQLVSAAHNFHEATQTQSWRMVESLPILGGTALAISDLARASDNATQDGKPLLSAWATSESILQRIGIVLGQRRELAELASDLAQVRESLYDLTGQTLVRPVAPVLRAVISQVDILTRLSDMALSGSELVPSMLGFDEPRRWLIILKTPGRESGCVATPHALATARIENGELIFTTPSTAPFHKLQSDWLLSGETCGTLGEKALEVSDNFDGFIVIDANLLEHLRYFDPDAEHHREPISSDNFTDFLARVVPLAMSSFESDPEFRNFVIQSVLSGQVSFSSRWDEEQRWLSDNVGVLSQ